MKIFKRNNLFRIRFEDGSHIFVLTKGGWAGLFQFTQSMCRNKWHKIYISQASLKDIIRYTIRGK